MPIRCIRASLTSIASYGVGGTPRQQPSHGFCITSSSLVVCATTGSSVFPSTRTRLPCNSMTHAGTSVWPWRGLNSRDSERSTFQSSTNGRWAVPAPVITPTSSISIDPSSRTTYAGPTGPAASPAPSVAVSPAAGAASLAMVPGAGVVAVWSFTAAAAAASIGSVPGSAGPFRSVDSDAVFSAASATTPSSSSSEKSDPRGAVSGSAGSGSPGAGASDAAATWPIGSSAGSGVDATASEPVVGSGRVSARAEGSAAAADPGVAGTSGSEGVLSMGVGVAVGRSGSAAGGRPNDGGVGAAGPRRTRTTAPPGARPWRGPAAE